MIWEKNETTCATNYELWFLKTSTSNLKFVFYHFRIDKGSLPDLLYEACFVIDAMGEKAVNEVRNWFCNFILEPYRKLFTPGMFFQSFIILFLLGQPDAAFDKTKRRFAWLLRTLKDFQHRYDSIFPSEWNLRPMIAYEFCRQTKLHLDEMLSN